MAITFIFIVFTREAFCRRSKDDLIFRIRKVVESIQAHNTQVWIDTAELGEIRKAKEAGISGGTSNPSLITEAIRKSPDVYIKRIRELADKYLKGPRYLSLRLLEIERMLNRLGFENDSLAKVILLELTGDLIANALEELPGPMSWEVDPRFHNDSQAMIEEARLIYEIAEERGLDLQRLYIKIPATEAGLMAVKFLIAEGINVNLTLVFSVAQALEGLRVYEVGIDKAKERGLEIDKIYMCISPFLGRWDDFFQKQGINILDSKGNPVAGLYFAKILYQRYLQEIRQGGYTFPYRPKIIMASIRNINHIQQLIGTDILTIPPKILFSPQFSLIKAEEVTIAQPIPQELIAKLLANDLFARSMKDRDSFEKDGLSLFEIDRHPLVIEGNNKFIQLYNELLELIEFSLLN